MTTQEILEAARAAKQAVALASSRTRQSVLERMADALCAPDSVEAILAANAEDMAAAKGHISDVMLDRLALTPERIGAMAKGILEVAALPDPVGAVLNRVELHPALRQGGLAERQRHRHRTAPGPVGERPARSRRLSH